jgi:hydroxypyruvate isomerase
MVADPRSLFLLKHATNPSPSESSFMLRFAANLTMMYNEVSFLDRFDAAADDGFTAVEYLFPYEHSADEIAARLQRRGLTQALFNLPPGNWAAGERGMACMPERCGEFRQTIATGLSYAQATGVRNLHIMAGITPADTDPAVLHRTYIDNLRLACDLLGEHGITVLVEPINRRDMPGYYLTHQAQAHEVCAEVARPNIKVQMDLYHCQVVEGDLATKIQRYFPGIGHIQIASVPDRHEPDEGEVNYGHLFGLLESLGYAGYVGCEYRPRQGSSAGLGWWRRYILNANALPE